MKKYLWIIITAAFIIALVTSGFFIWRHYKNHQTPVSQTSNSSPATSAQTPSVPATPTPTSVAQPTPTLVFPISNFSSRATTDFFGTYYSAGGSSNPDRLVCPNATYYAGYHTAIDLETTAAEANQNVPVFAIASGTVRQIGAVSGYGGLIVVQYTLASNDYTAYYGHIDLATVKVKTGEAVTVGETLASLGAACSTSNGDVRKHLHFGLHKGTSIVVSGYVSDQSTLSNWQDPLALLKSLGAQ